MSPSGGEFNTKKEEIERVPLIWKDLNRNTHHKVYVIKELVSNDSSHCYDAKRKGVGEDKPFRDGCTGKHARSWRGSELRNFTLNGDNLSAVPEKNRGETVRRGVPVKKGPIRAETC